MDITKVTLLCRTADIQNLNASLFYICLFGKQVISFVSSAGVSTLSPYSATHMSVCTDITAILRYYRQSTATTFHRHTQRQAVRFHPSRLSDPHMLHTKHKM